MLGAGGALGGAALAAPAAAALAAPAAVPREVALLATYVAGTAYHEAGQAAAMLHPGDRLMLRREPRNDYDARAIEVRTRAGAKLGYLLRIDNHACVWLVLAVSSLRRLRRREVTKPLESRQAERVFALAFAIQPRLQ